MSMADLDSFHKAWTTRPWLYISSPMRGKWGDSPWVNCGRGIRVATIAWRAGWHPVVPQLSGVWEMICGPLDERNADGAGGWLEYCFSSLTRCDALYRIPGESDGADREVEIMERHGSPVIHGSATPTLAEFPRPTDYLRDLGGNDGWGAIFREEPEPDRKASDR